MTAVEAVESAGEDLGPVGTTQAKAVKRAIARAQDEETAGYLEWMASFAMVQDVRIKVQRKAPETYQGERCAGYLPTITEKVDDPIDYIRQHHGGGKYQMQVQLPNGKGGWQYGKSYTFDLTGPPKLELAAKPEVAEPPGPDPMAMRAFDAAERQADRERTRADAAHETALAAQRDAGKLEAEQLERILAPFRAQIEQLAATNRDLQTQLIAAATKPPVSDPIKDRVFEQSLIGESQRIVQMQERHESTMAALRAAHDGSMTSVRANHESEIRQLRASWADDVRRIEDRHDRAMNDLRAAHTAAMAEVKASHEREIRSTERAETGTTKALEIANRSQVDALDRENKRLTAELVALRAELVTLRERKDKTPAEQFKELAGMKESIDALTGGGGDGEDKSVWAQIAGAIANSAPIVNLAERFMGDGADKDDEDGDDEAPAQQRAARPAQQAAAQQHPPKGAVVQNPADELYYISHGGGQYEGGYTEDELRARVAQLQQAQTRRQQRRAAAAGQAAPAAAAPAQAAGGAVAEGLADSAARPPAPSRTNATGGAVPARPLRRLQPMAQPAAAAPPAATPKPKGKPPSEDQIKQAVTFMEQALSSGSKPESLATAARNLVPSNVLAYIHHVGVDQFLAIVGQVRPSSPLVTKKGRDYVHQVAGLIFAGG